MKEIDLGRDVENMPMTTEESPKKGKTRRIYPMLYIDGAEGMDELPKEGSAVIRFRRRELSLRDNPEGGETTGAQLEVRSIKINDEGDGGDLGDAFAKLKPGESADDSGYDYTEDEDDE